MGLGFYGRSFTLADPTCSIEGCTFIDGGIAGPCTGNIGSFYPLYPLLIPFLHTNTTLSKGTLSFAEIESIVADPSKSAMITLNTPAAVQEVVFSPSQWVSYDDNTTFLSKYTYANAHCISGLAVWAVSNDDRIGSAQQQLCDAIGCKVRAPPDLSGPILCGSTTACSRYHQVIPGDTCYSIYTTAKLTFESFIALNPPLLSDCSNLETGIRYCVQGTPDGKNDTSTCTATSTIHSTFTLTSTSTESGSSSMATTMTKPTVASNCELKTRIVSYGHTMDL